MAIQNRRGLMADFDPNKLLPGEFAFPLDTGEVFYCVAPGNVKRVATKEELQEILTSSPEAYTALQQLLSDLELNPSELTNILNNIANLQSGKLDKTGDSKDNTVTFGEAEEDEDIESGESHYTLFGKILKSIKTLRNVLAGKFDKTNIVQSAEISDTGKVASAAVTNALAQLIDEQNNNLAYSQVALTTYLNGYAAYGSGSTIEKIGKLVILRLLINSTYATISPYTPIAELPDGYKPILDTLGSSGVGIDGIHREIGVLSNGNIIVGNSQFAALSSFAATVIYFTN